MQVGDHRRVDPGEPARSQRGRGLVRALREHRVRPEVAQLARHPQWERRKEDRAVQRRKLACEMERAVAPAAAGEHPEVQLLPDRVPLACKAGRERELDPPRDEEDARFHVRATRRSVASSSPNTRSGEYSATEDAAAPRNRSRSPSSLKKRRTASARPPVSPGATSRPLTPSWTTSATPPASIASTGVPTASASTTVCGKFSQLEERIVASAARNSSTMRSRGCAPRKRTRSAIPSSRARPSSAARSGPSPAITNRTPSVAATASSARESDFCAVRRPAKASVAPSSL